MQKEAEQSSINTHQDILITFHSEYHPFHLNAIVSSQQPSFTQRRYFLKPLWKVPRQLGVIFLTIPIIPQVITLYSLAMTRLTLGLFSVYPPQN